MSFLLYFRRQYGVHYWACLHAAGGGVGHVVNAKEWKLAACETWAFERSALWLLLHDHANQYGCFASSSGSGGLDAM